MSMGIDDDSYDPSQDPNGAGQSQPAPQGSTAPQPDPSSMPGFQAQGNTTPNDNSGAAPVMGIPDDNSGGAPVTPTPPQDNTNQAITGLNQMGANQEANAGGQPQAAPVDPVQNRAPDQSTGPRGPAKLIASMLMGDGAAPLQTLLATQKSVDPSNSQPQGNQNLMAIDAAFSKGGLKEAMPLLQANRVAFNAKQAFAYTALQGIPGKGPDLNAAINAANDAEQHVLDGSVVKFSHAGNGKITATVSSSLPGMDTTVPLTVDQFRQYLDVGKDGQWDKLQSETVPGVLQRLAKSQSSSGDAFGPSPTLGQDSMSNSKSSDRMTAPSSDDGASAGGRPAAKRTGQDSEYSQPHAQSLDAFPGPNATRFAGNSKADDAIDADRRKRGLYPGDQEDKSGMHDSHGHWVGPKASADPNGYGEQLEARSRAIFPDVGHEAERQQWMAAQSGEGEKLKNNIDVATEKGRVLNERAQTTGSYKVEQEGVKQAGGNTIQQTKNQGAQGVADTRAGAYEHASDNKLEGTKDTNQSRSGDVKYKTDARSNDVNNTNNARSGDVRYKSDNQLEGTKYGADTREKGVEYKADTGLEGTEYNADSRNDSSKYGSDQRRATAGDAATAKAAQAGQKAQAEIDRQARITGDNSDRNQATYWRNRAADVNNPMTQQELSQQNEFLAHLRQKSGIGSGQGAARTQAPSVQSSAPAPQPNHDAAVKWARANPQDPRSARILQANGQ